MYNYKCMCCLVVYNTFFFSGTKISASSHVHWRCLGKMKSNRDSLFNWLPLAWCSKWGALPTIQIQMSTSIVGSGCNLSNSKYTCVYVSVYVLLFNFLTLNLFKKLLLYSFFYTTCTSFNYVLFRGSFQTHKCKKAILCFMDMKQWHLKNTCISVCVAWLFIIYSFLRHKAICELRDSLFNWCPAVTSTIVVTGMDPDPDDIAHWLAHGHNVVMSL